MTTRALLVLANVLLAAPVVVGVVAFAVAWLVGQANSGGPAYANPGNALATVSALVTGAVAVLAVPASLVMMAGGVMVGLARGDLAASLLLLVPYALVIAVVAGLFLWR